MFPHLFFALFHKVANYVIQKNQLSNDVAEPFSCERAWFALIRFFARVSKKAERNFLAGKNFALLRNYAKAGKGSGFLQQTRCPI